MDGKGAWRDTVSVERLWRTIKYEEVYLRAYDTVSDATRDRSPVFHPVESRIRSSFGPVRPGVATAWGAKPVVERSAPGCCGAEALRAA